MDPEILWDICGIFGVGNVYGPRPTAKNRCWYYKANGFENVQYIAALTWHYLSTEKREQYRALMKNYYTNRKTFLKEVL